MPAKRILSLSIALLLLTSGSASATSLPTIQFEEINPGSDASWALDNGYSTSMNGWVYFAAEDSAHGNEIWRSNGEVTQLVKDIRVGTSGSSPDSLYAWNGYVYFSANDGTHGNELWRTDGTTAGTTMVADINGSGSSFPYFFSSLGSNLIFRAQTAATGSELYKFDGTNVTLLKDIRSGTSGSDVANPTTFNGKVYFSASDGEHGYELWVTDGTTAGTNMLVDIQGGPAGSGPTNFTIAPAGALLVFSADDGVNGRELWKTDGTVGGTSIVQNIDGSASFQPEDLTLFNGELYFSGLDYNAGEGPGRELYRTAGPSSIQLVKDLWSGSDSGHPEGLIVLGNKLYFQANNGTEGRELWRSDGTEGGTELVIDINVGGGDSDPFYTPGVVIGDALYFVASEDGDTGQVWRMSSDATVPEKIVSSDPALYSSWASCNSCPKTALQSAGGRLFFPFGDDGTTYGMEFAWLTEPTYVLPSTDSVPSSLTAALIQLSALTAAAALSMRRRNSRAVREN